MLLGTVFKRFIEQAPVCVAVRATLEAALHPAALDPLFQQTAERQYQRQLLFSTCVDLMSLVVSRTHRSIHAASQASSATIGVSLKSVDSKLANVEPTTTAALVRYVAGRLAPVIRRMKGMLPPPLTNFRTKILDGNHLGRTQRRLKPLRDVAAGPLPGQTLVVLDPALGLAVDVIGCEDGHAQERSLLEAVLPTVDERDLWIADRNFFPTKFLFGIAARLGRFVIRQHASTLRWERAGRPRRQRPAVPADVVAAGRGRPNVAGAVGDDRAGPADARRRDRDSRADQPERAASAPTVAELYRQRWTIEGVFQTLTTVLHCELNTLGYPKAALFAFGVALLTFNVYATVKAALRAAHGVNRRPN